LIKSGPENSILGFLIIIIGLVLKLGLLGLNNY